MPSKSIFRQPGARHFQLVHRSQRDPLINDPDASAHVLKPFERDNVKKGKSRADLETLLADEDLAADSQRNVGEASLYGIYYDDTEYDYMRHLRAVGAQEDGVESILIEAPSTSKQKSKAKSQSGFKLQDLPEGVLASTSELPRTYESQQAIPESIAGFQPDMDAHLRQVLEALEDDAFVDDGLDDDFFSELVADGERDSDEEVEFPFREEGIDEEEEGLEGEDRPALDENASWEDRFAAFKKSSRAPHGGSDDGYDSEGGDTVGTLPAMSVIGGKKRRKGSSDATGYSMSSSSMFRNEALQTLDERFDQMMLREYNEDEDDDHDCCGHDGEHDHDHDHDHSDDDEAPELISSRDDFESMVNTFLNDFEILGRKMKPKMEGETGLDKLDTFRRAMGQDERVRVALGDEEEEVNDDDLFPEEEDKKDRWDCETILTTYTNLENHPRLIRAHDPKPAPKIVLDRKTGMPSILNTADKTKSKGPSSRVAFASTSDDTDGPDTETEHERRGQAVGRPRGESKDDKKARKAAVKADKQMRRVEKKSAKEQFGAEFKMQKKMIANKELRLKKL